MPTDPTPNPKPNSNPKRKPIQVRTALGLTVDGRAAIARARRQGKLLAWCGPYAEVLEMQAA